MLIEELLRDYRVARMNLAPTDYRVNIADFGDMVDRLCAKVEEGEPYPDGRRPLFVSLHTSAGSMRVYGGGDVKRGEFLPIERVEAKPRIADQLGEQLLEYALKALTERDYNAAAMLVHAFVELRDAMTRASFGAAPAGFDGSALRISGGP